MTSRKIPDEWAHKIKKGFPIRTKTIKGHEYAYQRLGSGRNPDTGKVWVKDHHLGAWAPARQRSRLEELDRTDVAIIAAAWRRGETMAWVQSYITTVLIDAPGADPIYRWLRSQGIKRTGHKGKRERTEEEEIARKVEWARRREEVQREMGRRWLAQEKEKERKRKASQARRREEVQRELERAKR